MNCRNVIGFGNLLGFGSVVFRRFGFGTMIGNFRGRGVYFTASRLAILPGQFRNANGP